MEALKALQVESWGCHEQTKGFAAAGACQGIRRGRKVPCLQTLDKLSTQLAAAVAHTDPVVGQLLAIKQLAWLVRDTGGQAALLLSKRTCRRPPTT